MMSKLDLLVAHLGDMGVSVEWADLGPVRRGEYLDDDKLVRLNYRLTTAQAIATCAHECGHAIFGDRCSTPSIERRAWEIGSSLAIDVSEYATAESIVGHHSGALATELGVTPLLVESWRRWYLRRFPVEMRHRVGEEL